MQRSIIHLSEPLCSESMLVKNCASVGKTCQPFCLQINYKWGISTSVCDFKADLSMLCSCVYVSILNNLGQNSKITSRKTDDEGVKSRENRIGHNLFLKLIRIFIIYKGEWMLCERMFLLQSILWSRLIQSLFFFSFSELGKI